MWGRASAYVVASSQRSGGRDGWRARGREGRGGVAPSDRLRYSSPVCLSVEARWAGPRDYILTSARHLHDHRQKAGAVGLRTLGHMHGHTEKRGGVLIYSEGKRYSYEEVW